MKIFLFLGIIRQRQGQPAVMVSYRFCRQRQQGIFSEGTLYANQGVTENNASV